jgi:hypothetical protein
MSHQQAPASAGSHGNHHRGSGATVRDSHRAPLTNWGKPTFFHKWQNINELTNVKHA